MTNLFSETANRIMQLKEGYRDEDAYGSGVEDFEEIMRFEVFELGNKDIFYTFKLYNPKIDLRKSREAIIKHILGYYYQAFKTQKLYGKWLTDKEAVLRIYGNNPICYNFKNQRVVIASDCGEDGVLLISDKPIRPCGGYLR